MAQHQEFQVLGGIAAGQEREQLDGAAQREVGSLESTRMASKSRRQRYNHTEHTSRETAAQRAHPSLRTRHAPPFYRWDGVDHGLQQHGVVSVGSRQAGSQRDATAVDQQVVLGPGLAAVCRVRAG